MRYYAECNKHLLSKCLLHSVLSSLCLCFIRFPPLSLLRVFLVFYFCNNTLVAV